MDWLQFDQLRWQAEDGETEAVLAAVDAEPCYNTTAESVHRRTLLHGLQGGTR